MYLYDNVRNLRPRQIRFLELFVTHPVSELKTPLRAVYDTVTIIPRRTQSFCAFCVEWRCLDSWRCLCAGPESNPLLLRQRQAKKPLRQGTHNWESARRFHTSQKIRRCKQLEKYESFLPFPNMRSVGAMVFWLDCRTDDRGFNSDRRQKTVSQVVPASYSSKCKIERIVSHAEIDRVRKSEDKVSDCILQSQKFVTCHWELCGWPHELVSLS